MTELTARQGEFEKELMERVAVYPDWPKPGVSFKDASPIYADPRALRMAILLMGLAGKDGFVDAPVDAKCLLVPEARGLILGSAIASNTNMGLVMVRKSGKIPGPVLQADYSLEYGQDELEIPAGAIPNGAGVLIHDDLLATGGTACAAAELTKQAGARIAGFLFFMELMFLDGRQKLEEQFDVPVVSALKFSE